jgi:hypothetical protein
MKKAKRGELDDLRPRYERSDFPGPMTRGKYAARLRKASNIVILQPEVAAAFPNDEAVNEALLSLIKVARASTRLTKRSSGRGAKRRAA